MCGVKVNADEKDEIIAVLDPGVEILHGASIVDIDEGIELRKIRISAVHTHIRAVLRVCDRTEKRDHLSFKKVVRELRIIACHGFGEGTFGHRGRGYVGRGNCFGSHFRHHKEHKEKTGQYVNGDKSEQSG